MADRASQLFGVGHPVVFMSEKSSSTRHAFKLSAKLPQKHPSYLEDRQHEHTRGNPARVTTKKRTNFRQATDTGTGNLPKYMQVVLVSEKPSSTRHAFKLAAKLPPKHPSYPGDRQHEHTRGNPAKVTTKKRTNFRQATDTGTGNLPKYKQVVLMSEKPNLAHHAFKLSAKLPQKHPSSPGNR